MKPQTEGQQKIGTGHAWAMARQGLKELRGAVYAESNVAQPPEYGLYGTKTPGEVAEDRRNDPSHNLEEEVVKTQDSVLADRIQQAQAREQSGRDSRETDRDR